MFEFRWRGRGYATRAVASMILDGIFTSTFHDRDSWLILKFGG